MRTGVRVGPFWASSRVGGNGCLLFIVGLLALSVLGYLSAWLGAWVAWTVICVVGFGAPLLMLAVGIRGLMKRRHQA